MQRRAKRETTQAATLSRGVKSRFGNCEVRAFDMKISEGDIATGDATEVDIHELRPEVILTEVELEAG